MSTVTKIIDLIKTELAAGNLSNLKAIVTGTPDEQAAAQAILDNLRQTALEVESGVATGEDLKFAVAEAKGGLVALADAKVLRVEKAAIGIALKILGALIP